MREKKYHVYLTEEERSVVIKALIDEKNLLISAGHYTDAVDDFLIRIVSSKPKYIRII